MIYFLEVSCIDMPSSLPAKKKPAAPAKKQAGPVKKQTGTTKKQAKRSLDKDRNMWTEKEIRMRYDILPHYFLPPDIGTRKYNNIHEFKEELLKGQPEHEKKFKIARKLLRPGVIDSYEVLLQKERKRGVINMLKDILRQDYKDGMTNKTLIKKILKAPPHRSRETRKKD